MALRRHKRLRVITNNLNVATILSTNDDFELIVAGGLVRHRDGGLIGESTIDFIQQFRVDFGISASAASIRTARCLISTIGRCAPQGPFSIIPEKCFWPRTTPSSDETPWCALVIYRKSTRCLPIRRPHRDWWTYWSNRKCSCSWHDLNCIFSNDQNLYILGVILKIVFTCETIFGLVCSVYYSGMPLTTIQPYWIDINSDNLLSQRS